jgi:hypothetical protein
MPNIYGYTKCSFRTYQIMPRAEKIPRSLIGYEPNPEQAKFLMEVLVSNLNRPALKVAVLMNSADPQGPFARTLDLSEMQYELIRLVEAWKASGPNTKILFARYPELRSRLLLQRIHLVLTDAGHANLVCENVPQAFNVRSLKDLALMQFFQLIVNPEWRLLGGPCARCGMYFLKNTKRQKGYCSPTCGSRATSIASTRARRMRLRTVKLQKAQAKIDEWQKQAPAVHWKKWVSSELQLSIHWLTRAVNKGQLRPPVESLDGTA